MCTETPRPSHKLEAIQKKLKEVSDKLGFDCEQDEAGNVRIRKEATKGLEHATKVILQSHLDMVTSKTKESQINFDTDPIEPMLDGDYLKAKGTTLGADDGIGIAASLAILVDKDLKHGPIECLFTANEETTMDGAKGIAKSPFLQGTVLINLDSEEMSEICVGCAGGFQQEIKLKAQRMKSKLKEGDYENFTLSVFGLRGGHTGVDINKGRANALQLLAQLLASLSPSSSETTESDGVEFYLLSLNGGNAPNAIPRDATAQFLARKSQKEQIEKSIAKEWKIIKEKYKKVEQPQNLLEINGEISVDTSGMKMTLESQESKDELGCTNENSKQIISAILQVPHGIMKMNPELKDDILSSVAFSMLNLPAKTSKDEQEDVVKLSFLGRASDRKENKVSSELLESVASRVGAYADKWFNVGPGWAPVTTSNLLLVAKAAHKQLFKKEPRVYSVHAGLECGYLRERYPDLDCISIGPQIQHAHSPDEQLVISSVQPFYQWLKLMVTNLSMTTVKSEAPAPIETTNLTPTTPTTPSPTTPSPTTPSPPSTTELEKEKIPLVSPVLE